MLDKNIQKYISINDRQIIVGQTSSGIWYCKEIPCENCKDADVQIGEMNKVLNKYNKKEKTPLKEKKTLKTG